MVKSKKIIYYEIFYFYSNTTYYFISIFLVYLRNQIYFIHIKPNDNNFNSTILKVYKYLKKKLEYFDNNIMFRKDKIINFIKYIIFLYITTAVIQY